MSQRGDDADRRFEARLQAVESIGGRGNEWIRCFVVVEDAHDEAIADGGEEIRLHILRRQKIDGLAIFEKSGKADMGVFPGAGDADDRFRTEGDVEPVSAEYFTNHNAGFQFIICRLQRVCREEPVELKLFANVKNMTIIIDLRFDPADFFMSHFYMHAAGIEFFDRLFHSGADIAAHALPVLLLQALGNGKMLYGLLLARCLHPEFQLCAGGEYDVLDLREWEIFHPLDLCADQELSETVSDIFAGLLQNGTGINEFAIVDEEARNTKRADRKTGFFIYVIIIIVYIPIHGAVSDHVDAGIVQCGDIHKHDRRTICLDSFASEEIFVVLHEDLDRDAFICIIACKIDSDQRDEPNFRMLCQ